MTIPVEFAPVIRLIVPVATAFVKRLIIPLIRVEPIVIVEEVAGAVIAKVVSPVEPFALTIPFKLVVVPVIPTFTIPVELAPVIIFTFPPELVPL